MSATTDVPVTIAPEAEARLTELGMHKELEQMIAHVRVYRCHRHATRHRLANEDRRRPNETKVGLPDN